MNNKDNKDDTARPRILLNRYERNDIEGEAFVADHIFSYIISGKHEVWSGNERYKFEPGNYRFFRRNQLAKYVKRTDSKGFRSIAVHIDQHTLKSMSSEYGLVADRSFPGSDVQLLKPNLYLDRYMDSLAPYLNNAGAQHEHIVSLKVKELVFILLATNPLLQHVLFDFSDPGKIDLEAFMNTHYRYNEGVDRFAFLTGRSLSTFKRDFAAQFHTTPGKWLTRRRLEEAQYLITEKKKVPSEIYLDLGFEDLSHFSFAYKKAFGVTPSDDLRQ
ncbi:AraC family transcriptional regulator [Chitinophaga sp. S165]|uniref:helix-turn-helix domain-containing protein n=1 Tax=Chitinophaga sp. S165 TaxID=2135462 RepID=UPI000D71494C|nr:AraC family transcriptional regulator [Chitinophaga sp. S165]